MKNKSNITLLVFILFLLNLPLAKAQLTAPGSNSTIETEYPASPETDSIFIFCTESEMPAVGELRAQTSLTGTKTFLWEKYNPETSAYEFHFSESSEGAESTISSLEDGGYRVTITQGETTEISRAWVFNNWLTANASIPDSLSTCTSFKMFGTFLSAPLVYYDPANNTELEVFKDLKMEWKTGETTIATVQNPQIFDPPAIDTEYAFRVYDRLGCESTAIITYDSKVTKAKFSVDFGEQNDNKDKLEAPLTVNFINESENSDPGQYEWFFFRDLDEIKEEGENSQQPIDSIMIVAYDENPVYTYENTGSYMVKLVSKNVSEFHTCVDTFYMPEYIVIEPSFIEAPNFFSPDGDGNNDEFVVLFRSMQSIKIQIFNRWGKRIHFYKNNDVRGFGNSYPASVWDGKLGNRYASPGVYYYVAEGIGRDGEAQKGKGFFHLFRGKD
jgi:gliding motility-associated-like protein